MPSDKKGGQGQGQNRQNGGMREKAGQQIREGAENVSNRVQEGFESAREGVAHGYRRVEGTIARNPAPSILLSFGVGFGLGIVLCQLIGQEKESWTERNLGRPFRQFQGNVREGVKHVPDHVHHLAEAIAGHLPDAVRRRIG
jgi:hypothetical protein